MPADRSKSTRRGPSSLNGNNLTWTAPVETQASIQTIEFAPNLTPVTFNEPPPSPESPESTLFPPPADCPSPRRNGHGQKKPENHIPRPPNAFILFRSSFIHSQHVSTEVETNHSTLSKIIGLTWKNLPHDQRQIWYAKAKAAFEEHKRRYPQYSFRPLHTKGKGPEKRKVREVGPKDLKRCEKIAELLVEGKKGQELDAAIKEFDLHHVPQIVTRFETPLTARQYRRSSSAPVPDTEQGFCPSTPPARPRKVRAASSQPARHPSPAPAAPPMALPSPAPTEAESEASFYDAVFSPPYAPSQAWSQDASFPGSQDASFPGSQDVSFVPDFNNFSFTQSPCAPSDSYNLYTAPPSVERGMSPLSIDTTLLDSDWTRSSSPHSQCSLPATPCFEFETLSGCGGGGGVPDFQLYSPESYYPPFVASESKHIHSTPSLDLAFSAFIASLPPNGVYPL